MNKKTLGLLAVVCLSGVTGCGAKTYSVGLGYSASFKAGQLDVTTAVAAFDKDGKVYDVRFDVVQVKFTANEAKDGLTLTNKNVDVNGSVTTKLELGLGYNMLNSSAIKKECDEQIEAFADWCVGKTAEEVKKKRTSSFSLRTTPLFSPPITKAWLLKQSSPWLLLLTLSQTALPTARPYS